METNQSSITASYLWTARECIRSFAWQEREDNQTVLRLIGKVLLFMFVPLFVFVILVAAIVSPGSLFDFGSWWDGLVRSSGAMAGIVGFVVLFVGLPHLLVNSIPRWSQKRRIRQYFAGNPGSERTVVVKITPEALAWDFGDGTRLAAPWQACGKVIQSKEGFLFSPAAAPARDKCTETWRTWLPRQAFQSRDDLALFETWAQPYTLSSVEPATARYPNQRPD